MIRGTTPVLRMTLPFDTSLIEQLYVTISQSRVVRIEKTLPDCACDQNTVILRLGQEDTLKLSGSQLLKTELQLRVLTKNGEALASDIIDLDVGTILKDGVI